MVWQLHYTSAESGPTGRAGFQFVAQSPGLPDGLAGAVARHLTYRPPPGAPLSPSRGQILAMPAALGYTPLDHGLDHGPGREPGRGRCWRAASTWAATTRAGTATSSATPSC